jgi:hypothetical protein
MKITIAIKKTAVQKTAVQKTAVQKTIQTTIQTMTKPIAIFKILIINQIVKTANHKTIQTANHKTIQTANHKTTKLLMNQKLSIKNQL